MDFTRLWNQQTSEKAKRKRAYFLYVGFHSGVRRRQHVTSDFDVADDRQGFVRTLSVDANVALTTHITTISSRINVIVVAIDDDINVEYKWGIETSILTSFLFHFPLFSDAFLVVAGVTARF